MSGDQDNGKAREEPEDLLGSVLRRHSIWSRIHLKISPSFDTPVSYLLCSRTLRDDANWYVVRAWHTPQLEAPEDNGYPLRDIFEIVDVEKSWAVEKIEMFAGISVPISVTDDSYWLDGVGYNLTFSGAMVSARISWACDGPSAWNSLTDAAKKFGDGCEKLKFERFYLDVEYDIQVVWENSEISDREFMMIRRLDATLGNMNVQDGMKLLEGKRAHHLGVFNREAAFSLREKAEQLGLRTHMMRSNKL